LTGHAHDPNRGGAAGDDAGLRAWSALLQGLPQAAWVVALATQRVVAANAAAGLLLGRPAQALIGESAVALSASPEDRAYWAAATADDCGELHSDALLARPGGGGLPVSRSIRPVADAAGGASYALVLLRDRSAEQHADAAVCAWMNRSMAGSEDCERRLHALRLATLGPFDALSLTDALTGQPNRRRLAECLDQTAARARHEGGSFAMLVLDLDRFRHINESLGHEVGDQVLRDMAQRIHGCLRAGDTLARLGADQFALLVCPADAAAAEATARRLLKVVSQPCLVADTPFTLTCSIGIALCPAHGTGLDDLTRHAESAMRAVKLGGRAGYRLHQARAEGDRRSHMKLDHAMRQALVSQRFRLHYQPQVALGDGRLVGAEALLRWHDPELGDVPPARFIPVAEDSGFIVALGDWVLSQAVRQAALWHLSGQPLPVAVNVSALQFQQPQFVDRVASVLAISGLPAHLLELELTESILVNDADEALRRLQALAALGVRLSIDDFGTGYSSLAYLKRFPIDKLKIDRSFVMGLPDDRRDAGIVRAILQMARALGMQVIAEGVETEAQRAFLQDAGCDSFQGFLFAPALDALSFEQRRDAEALVSATPRRRPVDV